MLEISKVYRKHVYNQLQTVSDDSKLLNPEMVESKVLSFLSELGTLGQESKSYTFYDKTPVDSNDLLESFINGLSMLMSLGYELKVESIKDYMEIPVKTSINKQFIKVYKQALIVCSTYRFEDYQNALDDYLTLGFLLNLDLDDILNKYSEQYK